MNENQNLTLAQAGGDFGNVAVLIGIAILLYAFSQMK